MKIFVTIPKGDVFDSFFNEEIMKQLSKIGTVEYNDTQNHLSEEELIEKLKDASVCITGWGDGFINEKIISSCKQLSIIAHTGGSVGGIVSEDVYDKGIKVLSGNEIYAESVAEGVICYILYSLRRIPYYTEKMKTDGWHEKLWINEGLIGKEVGLIGFGAVSRYLVDFLKPFKCKIYVFSNHMTKEEAELYGVEKSDMDYIFSSCDVISVQLAQNSETYHCISYELLGKIKKGALFVNTSRGSVVDEKALVETIENNGYRAVLDVYETEPLPMDSILRNNDSIMLIPHMAGPTMDRRQYVTKRLIEEIKNVLEGKESELSISREKMRHMTK